MADNERNKKITEEVKKEIALKIEELHEIDDIQDRKRDVESALIKANSFFVHNFFSMRIVNAIIADLNAIKKDLLPKEERDIFAWERIHENTLKLDVFVDDFEKRRKGSRAVKKLSEQRKLFRKSNTLKKFLMGEESLLRQLAGKHNEIEKKVDDILAMVRASRHLGRITSKISKEIQELKHLLEEDEKICIKLKKNYYVQLKLMGYFKDFLKREYIFTKRKEYKIKSW